MPTPIHTPPALPDEIRGYRVKSLLGAGAMGAVWRAVVVKARRGLATGDEVALKILDSRFVPDATIVRRFKREAGVGLGTIHPSLARVFEIGSLRLPHGRLHFIVQELLSGASLRSRLDQEGPQPEPVIREVARQIADALAFLHARKIVHRDLKPANLFLDERGQVKLVDFGLARILTDPAAADAVRARAASEAPPSSGATSSGRFLGTVAYAAPEQLAGAVATAQSDLYALGLVLYEMATGGHAFARELDEGFDSYVTAVQSRDASLVTEVRPELSYFLARVIQLLIERDPALRFADAAELAEAFARGERSDFWRGAVAAGTLHVSAGRRRLQVRRATRLLGRSQEQSLLADEVRAALRGRGRRVVIEGAAGIGKTRLVDALADWLERRGPEAGFLVVRGTEGARPLEPLRELLADAFGPDAGTAEVTAQSADSLRPALAELLLAVARRAPLLLVVDGAERCDVETLRVLETVAAGQEQQRILLLLTVGTDRKPDDTVASALATLRQGATVLSLPPLDVPVFAGILRDLAIERPSAEKAARRLHEIAAGNPGDGVAIAEWLRDRGELQPLDSRRFPIGTLPPAVEARFAPRLAALAPESLLLAEAAAVLGTGLRTHTLQEILGLPPARFTELLVQLEGEKGLLVPAGGTLRFREPLLRHCLVARAPLERRREVHRLAAHHYHRESREPAASRRTALKAAIHAELAGERAILATHVRAAVRLLELEGAPERAWRLATAAEGAARLPPPEPKLLAQALVLRGPLAHRFGRREDELAIWTESARLSAQLGDPVIRAQAYHGLGRLSSRTGRFLAAENHLRQAEQAALAAPRGAGVDRSLILLDLAETLLWSGDEERCASTLEQAEEVIDAGAAISSIGRYFKERGNLLLELERFDESEEAFRQGRALVRGPALRALHRALVLGTGRLLRELADWDRARRAAELARKSAAADLDLRHLAQAWYLLGDVEARSGNPDAAALPYARALRLARRIQDDYLQVSSLASLSLLYRWKRFRHHSLSQAVRFARRAITQAQDLAVGRLEARGLAALALCYRDMGRMRWALAIIEKAVREAKAAAIRRRRAAEIYYVHGRILGEMGRTEAARASLDEARRRIERRLLGVSSRAVRARMLERDPLLRHLEMQSHA